MSNLTKRDFELIARALYASMPSVDAEPDSRNLWGLQPRIRYEQWERTLAEFSRVLPATNGNFQAGKFERFARTGKY